MRRAVILLGRVGAAVFCAALAWSFAQPLGTERLLRYLVQREVQDRVDERIAAVGDSAWGAAARRALGRTDTEIQALRQRLGEDSAQVVAGVVAKMLRADCPCRQRLAASLRESDQERLASLLEVRPRLVGWAEAAYAAVSRGLLREFRIFTASNAVAFGLLALVAGLRRGAAAQVLLPAVVIIGAVVITGGLYLFNQDWLHTLLFGDYLGWGYAAWLTLVAGLLGDILLNRARVSTQLVNLGLNAIGATAQVVPC